jgi:ribonuclease P protein subunit RPR2
MSEKGKKIALERIYRLFELAEKNPQYSKRYLTLAKDIGKKTTTRIPKELKNKMCKKCYSLNINIKNENDSTIITCQDCKSIRKIRN